MTRRLANVLAVLRMFGILALAALSSAANGQMPPFRKTVVHGVVVDPAANRVYWSNVTEPTSVEIVDRATQTRRGVAVSGPGFADIDSTGRLYVPSYSDGWKLIVVNTNDATFAAVIALDMGYASRALVDAQARKVYVLGEQRIAVIDADSHAIAHIDLDVPAYEGVVDTRNHRLYALSGDMRTLFAIDGIRLATTAIPLSKSPSQTTFSGITFNALANVIVVLTEGGKSLAIVDATNYDVSTIPLPGVANRALAFDGTTGRAYIPNPPSNAFTIVDTSTRQTVSMALPAQPNRIAINESTGQIYLGLLPSGVLVMDRATLGYFTMPVGTNPGAVVLDVARNVAYIDDGRSVLVIDGSLATEANAAAYGMAVEFHRGDLDHYVLTASAPEQSRLDTSAVWVRTGATLGTLVSSDGTTPMCRFYLPPKYGDSHLMMASVSECTATAVRFPDYVYESPDVFRVGLPNPATGSCAAGLSPVYRLWNRRTDSNHRYATDVTTRDAMVAAGWVVEGYGPEGSGICVPRPATYTLP